MQCKHIKQGKTKCKANAMTNKNYCFTHNPETREELIAASRKGGSAPKQEIKKLGIMLNVKKPRSPDGVSKLVEETLIKLDGGQIDRKTAYCISILASNMLKALRLKNDGSLLDDDY